MFWDSRKKIINVSANFVSRKNGSGEVRGNPVTGKDTILAPRRVVTFRCSGKLRERVNGGKFTKSQITSN
jgi:nucleoid DNA-binding protein